MNISELEKYMKNLSPELQEKVKLCKNMNEMTDLAAREGIELPDEALDIVTGGASNNTCSDSEAGLYMCCPKCGQAHGNIYPTNSGIGAILRIPAEFFSKAAGYPITNYVIDCSTCGRAFCAKSKGNVC